MRFFCGIWGLGWILMGAALADDEPPTRAPVMELDALQFMAGHWMRVQDGSVSEEGWFAPKGGLMVGVHRDVTAEGTVFFEYLRIETRPEGIFYVANPMGREGVSFQLTEIQPNRAVFENPAHDFPQRIEYRQSEDSLTATVSGMHHGLPRKETWIWKKT